VLIYNNSLSLTVGQHKLLLSFVNKFLQLCLKFSGKDRSLFLVRANVLQLGRFGPKRKAVFSH
jgi:hypothetical protein